MTNANWILAATMLIWIVALPALAFVRWMANVTKPREPEIEDEVLFKRLNGLH